MLYNIQDIQNCWLMTGKTDLLAAVLHVLNKKKLERLWGLVYETY